MCPNPPSPELVKSGFGSPTNEWMLKRVKQLEKTKQKKTDHGETVVTYFRS